MEISPSKLKVPSEITEGLDNAHGNFGDDRQVEPTVHALEAADLGAMEVSIISTPFSHFWLLIEPTLVAIMFKQPLDNTILAFNKGPQHILKVIELHIFSLWLEVVNDL